MTAFTIHATMNLRTAAKLYVKNEDAQQVEAISAMVATLSDARQAKFADLVAFWSAQPAWMLN